MNRAPTGGDIVRVYKAVSVRLMRQGGGSSNLLSTFDPARWTQVRAEA